MTTSKSVLIGLLIALIAGTAGAGFGVWFGFQKGFNMVLNEALIGDARDVTSRVESLKELRSGRKDKAVTAIEARMDDVLISFDMETPYNGLKPHTVAELRKAIDSAKAYRAKYPHAKKDDMRARMVAALFARAPY